MIKWSLILSDIEVVRSAENVGIGRMWCSTTVSGVVFVRCHALVVLWSSVLSLRSESSWSNFVRRD